MTTIIEYLIPRRRAEFLDLVRSQAARRIKQCVDGSWGFELADGRWHSGFETLEQAERGERQARINAVTINLIERGAGVFRPVDFEHGADLLEAVGGEYRALDEIRPVAEPRDEFDVRVPPEYQRWIERKPHDGYISLSDLRALCGRVLVPLVYRRSYDNWINSIELRYATDLANGPTGCRWVPKTAAEGLWLREALESVCGSDAVVHDVGRPLQIQANPRSISLDAFANARPVHFDDEWTLAAYALLGGASIDDLLLHNYQIVRALLNDYRHPNPQIDRDLRQLLNPVEVRNAGRLVKGLA